MVRALSRWLRKAAVGAVTAWTATSALGCEQKKSAVEQVGDAFVEHYVRADQQGALEFAALGAAAQLKRELEDSREARKDAVPDATVSFKRVGEEMREQRYVLRYDVKVGNGRVGSLEPDVRAMRIEVTDLGAGPKVVLFELK